MSYDVIVYHEGRKVSDLTTSSRRRALDRFHDLEASDASPAVHVIDARDGNTIAVS